MRQNLLIWVILCCLVCSCSNQKVTDYKDNRGRTMQHIVVRHFANKDWDSLTDYLDTQGKRIKEVDVGLYTKDELQGVSISTNYFDGAGRRICWTDIISYGGNITKEKHVYEYPVSGRMAEIKYSFHTNNFNDTDWTIKSTTQKFLTINEVNEKGDEIGMPLYTKEWPARKENTIDSTQALESILSRTAGRYITRIVRDTNFNVNEIITSNVDL